eukprot:GILI01001932.1.p1 GENE.GILI01001932.1~~GILI01001932.1.p1  ORF type:complete len:368 (-),score=139.80 GILI01001932.1:447-1550(-)
MENSPNSRIAVKLFIARVPNTFSEEDLKPVLEEFGAVSELSILRDKATGAHKGCAFAKFDSISDADNAIQALNNQRQLPGAVNKMVVKYADGEDVRLGLPSADSRIQDPLKLFVCSLPKTATEEEVMGLFVPFGAVESIFMMKDPQQQFKGCAFVKMTTKEECLNAIAALNGKTQLPGALRPLEVRFAEKKTDRQQQNVGGRAPPSHGGSQIQPPWTEYFTPEGRPYYYNSVTGVTQWEAPAPAGPQMGGMNGMGGMGGNAQPNLGPAGANIFIFHVPNEWSDQELSSHFQHFGTVIQSRIARDAAGRGKGYGFISYDNPASAASAIAGMDGFAAGSKRLKVSLKKGEDGSAMGGAHMGTQNRYAPY